MTRKLLSRLMAEADGEGADLGGSDSSAGSGAIGTGNDARVALLNQISDSADELRAEDLADINDDGTTEPFKVQRPTGEEEALVEEPAPKTPVEPEEEPDSSVLKTDQMVTRKINGKLVTKPLEQWLVDAAKVNAADEYLQDAARLRKEALRSVEPPQDPAPEPVRQGPSPEELAAQELAERRKLARAIQMGTEEEAVAAIEQLQNMTKAPTLTVEQVGRVADERLKFNEAMKQFSTEYNDLVSNKELYRMVTQADQAMLAQGDRRPYLERFTEIGNAVRAWRDDLIKSALPANAPVEEAKAPKAPVASLDAKRAAKAAAPRVPTAASKAATPPAEDDGEEDMSSVIASMAKARGGPQWMGGRG